MQNLDTLTIKQPLDVLIINPGALKQVYQGLGDSISGIEPPTLAALYATYIRNKGLAVDILDAPAFGLDVAAVVKLIAQYFDPKLIVLAVHGYQPSASTQNMPAASAICGALKKHNPNYKIMMTGTHPAALPERTLQEEAIDYVCSLEGPETILATAQYLQTGKGNLADIPSLLWRDSEDNIQINPTGSLMVDLDKDMPEAAYDLLPMHKYRAHNWHCFDHIDKRQPYASIYTTLGCPFKCSFCCINAPFGKPSYRRWSPETVIKQIDVLVKQYGVKNIKIVDEMFVLHKNHVLDICDLIIERGYDLNIWAYARIDTVRDEYLTKLRQAGFRWLALGIESGSKHVRDGVEKGRFGYKEIVETVRKIQDAGIYVIGNFIFGLPDDTYETMEETLDLALETNCEFANFYSAMAYPGSQLYTQAIEQGVSLPDSWIGYSQHSIDTHPLPTNTLSSGEVLKFRDEAFQRYFNNKHYLASLEKKFGEKVVEHIKLVNKVQLKRKLYDSQMETTT